MRSNSRDEQNLIQIDVSFFDEIFNAILDQHMIQNVIEALHNFVRSWMIRNDIFMFDFKQRKRLDHNCWNIECKKLD